MVKYANIALISHQEKTELKKNQPLKCTVRWDILASLHPPTQLYWSASLQRAIIFYSQQIPCHTLCNWKAPTICMMTTLSKVERRRGHTHTLTQIISADSGATPASGESSHPREGGRERTGGGIDFSFCVIAAERGTFQSADLIDANKLISWQTGFMR